MAICRVCKEKLKSKEELMKLNRSYYHVSCYRQKQLLDLVDIEEIEENITKGKQEYLERKQEIKDKKRESEQSVIKITDGKDELITWVQEHYDITTIPSFFFLKLASIVNGTYKGLREPITYHELLDMLQRKKRQLDIKLASKKFDNNLGRLNYDLAVVINQYDSYKKWKINREIELEELKNKTKEQQESLRHNTSQNQIAKLNKKVDKEPCIADLVDDIFGG